MNGEDRNLITLLGTDIRDLRRELGETERRLHDRISKTAESLDDRISNTAAGLGGRLERLEAASNRAYWPRYFLGIIAIAFLTAIVSGFVSGWFS